MRCWDSLYSNNKLHLLRSDHDPSGKKTKQKESTSLQRILTPVALCWVRLERVKCCIKRHTSALSSHSHTGKQKIKATSCQEVPNSFLLGRIPLCLLSSQKIIEGISVNKMTNFLVTDRYNNNTIMYLRVCVCMKLGNLASLAHCRTNFIKTSWRPWNNTRNKAVTYEKINTKINKEK